MRMKVTFLNNFGEDAMRRYVDSIITPSIKDRLNMRSAKIINNNIFRIARMKPISMLREEYSENPMFLEVIVENGYEQYSRELFDTARNTYLKLFAKFGCSDKDFFFEVFDD